MSATSLTFWFIILNCVMQARPPRAFPLLLFCLTVHVHVYVYKKAFSIFVPIHDFNGYMSKVRYTVHVGVTCTCRC